MSTGNNAGDPKDQYRLQKLYKSKERDTCPSCKQPGAKMYVAPLKGNYYVKCMPGTGFTHHPKCEHYEALPSKFSGRDSIRTAIRKIDGGIDLKVVFSMGKNDAGTSRIRGARDKDADKSDGDKMTFRSFLHLFWEESGFNVWHPAMKGTRHWGYIREGLLKLAQSTLVNGSNLAGRLYIPEAFSDSEINKIKQRRDSFMNGIKDGPSGNARPLGLLIGKVKTIEHFHDKYKLTVWNAPDFPFLLSKNIYNNFSEDYPDELVELVELKGSASPVRNLIVIATFTVSSIGVASIEKADLMPTTKNWIPYQTQFEKDLIDELTGTEHKPGSNPKPKRHYIKMLRYDLSQSVPLACVLLADTVPFTAMYIQSPVDDGEITNALKALTSKKQYASWVWDTGKNFKVPEFPPKAQE